MMEDTLRLEGLTTQLITGSGTLTAVDDVSLRIGPGEAVALVGESGCGKTMTALSVMRLLPANAHIVHGRVLLAGRNITALSESAMHSIRGRDLAMVFQDPTTFLNPLMRVGEQIAEAVRFHQGVSGAEARRQAIAALRRVRIPVPDRVVEYYPHQLSGGMRQRVVIAIAISCHPSLLIADEPTTALDVTIQAQIMQLLAELRRDLGAALLLITHDLSLVAEYCDRVYVMYAGEVIEEANIFSLFESPMHPYTAALLRSTLSVEQRTSSFVTIEGQPPNLISPPAGCRFHPRCRHVMDKCGRLSPPRFGQESGPWARCWLHESKLQ